MLTGKALARVIGTGLLLTAAGWILAGYPGRRLAGAGLILLGLALTVLPR
ncbi:hypothetical protein [Couchioplanes caeruleus]|nr:hypothetical protein [Couchioplanes caeruleus]